MQYPRVMVADGTIESIKWLGLCLMTLDHINKYLYAEKLPYIFEAGRIVMPLFIFVLAYNLSRPDAFERGAYTRTMLRLAIFGALATPPFIGLGGLISGWWPLNIMFALLVMTAILYLLDRRTIWGKIIAIIVFIIGGSSVEFWWPAVLLGIAVWSYCKQPRLSPLILAVLSLVAMRIINGNYWALAAIPIAIAACGVAIPMPRLKWVFYYFYPLHLAALWTIKAGSAII